MKSGEYYSRLRRKQDRFTQRQIALLLLASALVVVGLVYYGFSFLFSLSSRISSLRGTNSDEQVTDKGPTPARPILVEEYTATSSAQLKVNGIADAKISVELFQNGRSLGTSLTDSQGKFSFDTFLEKGANAFAAQTTSDKGRQSDKSEVYSVVFTNAAPKLDLAVKDGDSFKDNPVTISGNTDQGNSVTVNDHLVIVKSDGSFSYAMNLNGGDNKIKIVATDQAGNLTTKELTIKLN